LRTALVPDLTQIIAVDGELVTIDLDAEFNALAPTEQRLALAQITFAMTQIAAINRVKFLVAGQPASVPRGDGSSTDGPVSPADYNEFAPL
jgi:spore germination protein GerM